MATTLLRKRKQAPTFLLFSIFFFLALVFQIVFLPPTYEISLLFFTISIIPFFLVTLFLFFFSLGTFLLKSKVQGALIGCFVIGFLLFRLTNLTHPFFFILLASLFLTLELLFTYRK